MSCKQIVFGLFMIFNATIWAAESTSTQQESGSFIQVVIDSGFTGILIWVMLFACSVFTLGLLVDSLFKIRRAKICPAELLSECNSFLDQGNVQLIIDKCQKNNSPLAEIFFRVFKKLPNGYNAMEEAASLALRDVEDKMMQRVGYLNMFGAVAPMLGLLGTVTGMVSAFFTLGNASGVEKAQMLAMSISQALYTTAAGLFISIPAIVVCSILKNKIQHEVSHLEVIIGNLLEDIKGRVQ